MGFKVTALTPAMLLALFLAASPASAKCWSWQTDCDGGGSKWQKPKPSTSWAITNTSRQRLGDIYNPGHGRRVQIRDTSRRIVGYVERDGTVTNNNRQRIGTLEKLP